MTTGWTKIKGACKYCGVSERTMRKWLRSGLRHARLPSGHILVSFAAVDEFLERFCEVEDRAEQLVKEILGEVHGNQ